MPNPGSTMLQHLLQPSRSLTQCCSPMIPLGTLALPCICSRASRRSLLNFWKLAFLHCGMLVEVFVQLFRHDLDRLLFCEMQRLCLLLVSVISSSVSAGAAHRKSREIDKKILRHKPCAPVSNQDDTSNLSNVSLFSEFLCNIILFRIQSILPFWGGRGEFFLGCGWSKEERLVRGKEESSSAISYCHIWELKKLRGTFMITR
ncbi:uncharacterized protein LOC117621195 [Prunus dulcis]|uniref:uncharacterized protein LOC117621195 n=1 Tax=Prunus dulcis TaxID=3755 RepID=UPI0014822E61|nr:uncharacterized protein LOC117621195 [Prunus dulcis]